MLQIQIDNKCTAKPQSLTNVIEPMVPYLDIVC